MESPKIAEVTKSQAGREEVSFLKELWIAIDLKQLPVDFRRSLKSDLYEMGLKQQWNIVIRLYLYKFRFLYQF